MTKSPVDEILPNIPKRAPIWSVGITTIIVAVATSLVTIYLISREDIQQVIGWVEKHHDLQTESRRLEEATVIDNVMKLLSIKSQQILELSKAVATTQQNNFILMQRVDALEVAIKDLRNNLDDCHRKLSDCERRK